MKTENDMQFERKLDLKLILSILAAGIMTFGGILEETAMNIAFPTVMEEFGITLSYAQWITTGYFIAVVVMMPTTSFFKKRMKMRNIFIMTCAAFLVGLVLCYAAPQFIWIIVGRVIQGAAAGVAVPLMFNIVLEQTPYEHMGFAVGVATMTSALAPAFGPVYGGIVVQFSNWRMIFGFLIPVLIAALILGAFSIRQSSRLEKVGFDVPGFILFAASLSCLIFGLNLPSVFGWKPYCFVLLAAAVILFILFAKAERHTSAPFLNLKVFRTRFYSLNAASIYCCCTICPTFCFILPNFLQVTRGESALDSAMVLFAGCIVGAAVNIFAGHLLDKKGPKVTIRPGAVLALAGVILIAVFLAESHLAVLAFTFAVYMFGHGMCVGPNITLGMGSLPEELKPDGNAVVNMMQFLSGMVAMVISSGIISNAQVHGTTPAAGTLTGTMMSIFILIGVAAVLNLLENLILFFRKNAADPD